MIKLPKMIGASMNDCLVAAVAMVTMYWRQKKPKLSWNLPSDFEAQEWSEFYQKGLSYVRTSGIPYNNIKRFLRTMETPLIANLHYLEDSYGLRNLISLYIPPIVLYDHNFLLKGIRGANHSVILVDQTNELFISINPSMEPKFNYKIVKTDFVDAWKFTKNATIIIHPKSYRIAEAKVPTKNLMYFDKKAQGII